jgi:hypothetical protein
MDTKLPATFWSDPDFDSCDAQVLLAVLWIKTNERLDLLGFAEISPRVFKFQSRLDFEAFDRACEALGKGLVRDGNRYWLRDFVREQIGDGPSLVRNNMRKPLVRALSLVPSPSIKAEILREYPELAEGLTPEGAPKPQEQNREERNREEQSRTEQSQGGPGETARRTPKAGSTRPDQHPEPMRRRMVALAEVMRRRPDSVWSEAEKKALAATGLLDVPDEAFTEQVEAMALFYRAKVPAAKQTQFWRRSTLPILLNNWPSELDKARAWRRETGGEGDGVRMIA